MDRDEQAPPVPGKTKAVHQGTASIRLPAFAYFPFSAPAGAIDLIFSCMSAMFLSKIFC